MTSDDHTSGVRPDALAIGLGCFSVALGLTELAAPRLLARAIGVRGDASHDRVLQAFGLRELANGVAILAHPNEQMWMWSRVGGDLLDVLSFQASRRDDGSNGGRRSAAMIALLGVTALDVWCATQLGRKPHGASTSHQEDERNVERRGRTIFKNTPVVSDSEPPL